jgi:predicted transcriptional regulator
MKKAPCEYIIWHGLPVLRKEIATSLVFQHGLSQRQAAKKLGITPAAVSQYLSKKRGKLHITDKVVIEEIHTAAERIMEHGESVVIIETCRLCKIIKQKSVFPLEEEEDCCIE